MKMVGHHNELMENVILLVTVMEQDFHKQPCHGLLAKQRPSLKGGSGNEIDAISGVSSGRRCHKVPRRLKPRPLWLPYRSAGSAAPPQNRKSMSQFPDRNDSKSCPACSIFPATQPSYPQSPCDI